MWVALLGLCGVTKHLFDFPVPSVIGIKFRCTPEIVSLSIIRPAGQQECDGFLTSPHGRMMQGCLAIDQGRVDILAIRQEGWNSAMLENNFLWRNYLSDHLGLEVGMASSTR